MTQIISIVVSTLLAFGALTVSFLAHRHQVRRAEVLDAKERRLEAAERQMADRQSVIDRRSVLTQASMIDIRIVWTASSLVDGLKTPQLKITNLSNQPILDLRAWMSEGPIAGVSGEVTAAGSRSFPLSRPVAVNATTEPAEVNVDFTDAGGSRWRRDGSGGLREGTRLETGEWTWAPRESPDIFRAGEGPPYPRPAPTSAPAMRLRAWGYRYRLTCLTVAMAMALLMAAGIWVSFAHLAK